MIHAKRSFSAGLLLSLASSSVALIHCGHEAGETDPEPVAEVEQAVVYDGLVDQLNTAVAGSRPIHGSPTHCFDVEGGFTNADNADVMMWQCHYGPNQQWLIEKVAGSTFVKIKNVHGKCFDLYSASTAPSTPIEIYGCHGGANQQWRITPKGEIRSAVDVSKCVSVKGGMPLEFGKKLVLEACNGGPAQVFSAYKFNEIVNSSIFQPATPAFPAFTGGPSNAYQCVNNKVASTYAAVNFRDIYRRLDDNVALGALRNNLDAVTRAQCPGLAFTDANLAAVKVQLHAELNSIETLRQYILNGRAYIGDVKEVYDTKLDVVAGKIELVQTNNVALHMTEAIFSGLSAMGPFDGTLGAPADLLSMMVSLTELSENGGADLVVNDTYLNAKAEVGDLFVKMQTHFYTLFDDVVVDWASLQAATTLLARAPSQWPAGDLPSVAQAYEQELWKSLLPIKFQVEYFDSTHAADNDTQLWNGSQCNVYRQQCRDNGTRATLVMKEKDGFGWSQAPLDLCDHLFLGGRASKHDLFHKLDGWSSMQWTNTFYVNDDAETAGMCNQVAIECAYGRGAGLVPQSCPDGHEKDGALCYPNCASGYDGIGPVCWQECPSDYIEEPATCRRNVHSIWTSDPCPPGYDDRGLVCWRDAHVFGRDSYGRGAGTAMTCSSGYEEQDDLCYTPCDQGCIPNGPMCQ